MSHSRILMRDGISLSATILLPPEEGPHPVVLIRTAYNRMMYLDSYFPKNGMALVVQDCRGRYESDGEFYPFVNEAADGFDTLEWIGQQPWCNGSIGMFGNSYLASTQLLAAPEGSRFLQVLNPCFMAGDCWRRAYYCGGAFSLALIWSWICFEVASRVSHANTMPLLDIPKVLKTLPLLALDQASTGEQAPSWRDFVSHSTYDDYWKNLSICDKYEKFSMPVLLIGGWYDNYAAETVANYQGLREHAATSALRDSHRMLIGPWPHGINGSSTLGDVDFGPAALTENDASRRWLRTMLTGGKAVDFQAAPIRIFVMGINQWRDEYEWPPARTRFTRLYLREDARLALDEPSPKETPDAYTYDPADPVPTLGGNHSIGSYNPGLYEFLKPGPFDQRAVENRNDVLVYTSDQLEKDTEVTGHVLLKLYASSSALDTDFVARLTDVAPNGRSINITEGVLRARFRDDIHGVPSLLDPGEIYEFTIDLQVTSNVFLAGHRIRLQITSSNFPLWDRNLNTGENPTTGIRMQSARQVVFHDTDRPSHLLLPIIDNEQDQTALRTAQ